MDRIAGCLCSCRPALITRAALVLALLVPQLAKLVAAQTSDPDGGSPPFVMSVKGQIDQFNLPSGNILIQLPVRAKAGKYPTTYSLVENSHAFIGPPPQGSNDVGQWQVSGGFSGALGGSLLAQYAGTIVTFQNTADIQCNGRNDPEYSNFVVVEPNGTRHPLSSTITIDLYGCITSSISATIDGFTYSLQIVNGNFNPKLWDKAGDLLFGAGSPTVDADGVTIGGVNSSGESSIPWGNR